MLMKNLIILTFLLIFGATYSLKAQTNCKTYDDFVNADTENGLAKSFIYDQKSKFYYLLANDNNSLYIKAVIADELLQKKIVAFGNTIWIDKNGKRKRKTGIQFPLIDNKNAPQPPRQGKDDFGIKKFQLIQQFEKAKLIGFSGDNKIVDIKDAGSYTIQIHFNTKGFLVLEFAIPLSGIAPDYTPLNQKPLSVGFITGFMNTSRIQNTSFGNFDDQQSPQPNEAPNREMEEMATPTILWITNIELY